MSNSIFRHRIERKPEHTLVSCILYEGGKRKEIKYRDGRVSIAFYIGSTPASERGRASERRCILSTYCMAKEGLDIPRLDTLVMATPKGDIVQASGRVQRKHPDKKTPLIVDFVDTFSVFEALRWKRWQFYRQEQFACQTFNATNRDAQWFNHDFPFKF